MARTTQRCLALLAMMMMASVASAGRTLSQAKGPESVPGELLVQFRADVADEAKGKALAGAGLDKVESVANHDNAELVLVRAAKGIDMAAARSKLAELKSEIQFVGESRRKRGRGTHRQGLRLPAQCKQLHCI